MEDSKFGYKSIDDLVKVLKDAKGKTIGQIKEEYISRQVLISNKKPKRSELVKAADKGYVGNAVQLYLYNVPVNSDSSADFKKYYKQDIELKMAPLKMPMKNVMTVKERMALKDINFKEYPKNIYESDLYKKCKEMIIGFYLDTGTSHKNEDPIIDGFYWNWDDISDEDKKIIEKDYQKIGEKIWAGNAQSLSSSDTDILEASTTGGETESNYVKQLNSDVKAHKRRFAFKNGFVEKMYEQKANLGKESYAEFVLKKFNNCVAFLKGLKRKNFNLFDTPDFVFGWDVYRHNNNAIRKLIHDYDPELDPLFEDKTFRIRTPKLSNKERTQEYLPVSSTAINAEDIVREKSFEDSQFYRDLNARTIICPIFEDKTNNTATIEYVIAVPSLINDPKAYKQAKGVWEDTKEYFDNLIENWKSGKHLTKISDKKGFHLRPHAADGSVNYNGTSLTKQGFWGNSEIINDLIAKELKKKNRNK